MELRVSEAPICPMCGCKLNLCVYDNSHYRSESVDYDCVRGDLYCEFCGHVVKKKNKKLKEE